MVQIPAIIGIVAVRFTLYLGRIIIKCRRSKLDIADCIATAFEIGNFLNEVFSEFFGSDENIYTQVDIDKLQNKIDLLENKVNQLQVDNELNYTFDDLEKARSDGRKEGMDWVNKSNDDKINDLKSEIDRLEDKFDIKSKDYNDLITQRDKLQDKLDDLKNDSGLQDYIDKLEREKKQLEKKLKDCQDAYFDPENPYEAKKPDKCKEDDMGALGRKPESVIEALHNLFTKKSSPTINNNITSRCPDVRVTTQKVTNRHEHNIKVEAPLDKVVKAIDNSATKVSESIKSNQFIGKEGDVKAITSIKVIDKEEIITVPKVKVIRKDEKIVIPKIITSFKSEKVVIPKLTIKEEKSNITIPKFVVKREKENISVPHYQVKENLITLDNIITGVNVKGNVVDLKTPITGISVFGKTENLDMIKYEIKEDTKVIEVPNLKEVKIDLSSLTKAIEANKIDNTHPLVMATKEILGSKLKDGFLDIVKKLTTKSAFKPRVDAKGNITGSYSPIEIKAMFEKAGLQKFYSENNFDDDYDALVTALNLADTLIVDPVFDDNENTINNLSKSKNSKK